MAATSIRLAGKVKVVVARLMVTTSFSNGFHKASSPVHL